MSIFEMRKIYDENIGKVKEVKQEDPTVPKIDFAYSEHDRNRRCGNCNMYIMGGKCTLVKGDIDSKDGVCNFWSYRNTQPFLDKQYPPMLSKSDAGYILERGGTICGTCKHYKEPRKCMMVRGDISPDKGCCIGWMKKL